MGGVRMGGWHCIVLRRVDKGDQGMADSSAAVLPFHLHIYILHNDSEKERDFQQRR